MRCHCVPIGASLCVTAAAAAQALHLANQPQQQQMYSALAPTPPSMTPGPNPQSPQASFPSAQPTVYIHPQQVQHGYNHNHMAHVQQVSHNPPSVGTTTAASQVSHEDVTLSSGEIHCTENAL